MFVLWTRRKNEDMKVCPDLFLSFRPERGLVDPRDNTASYFLRENSSQEKGTFVFKMTQWHFGAVWEWEGLSRKKKKKMNSQS